MKQAACTFLLLLGVSWPAFADSGKPPSAILLVARAELPDPNFRDSIVLVMNTVGPAPGGVIVNRPTRIPVSRLFPELQRLETLDDKIYFGGPVDIAMVSFVFRADTPPDNAVPVLDGVYYSANADLLRKLLGRARPMENLRIFVGYAGWAPGQLEGEIDRGDWSLAPAGTEAIFGGKAEHPWPGEQRPANRTSSIRGRLVAESIGAQAPSRQQALDDLGATDAPTRRAAIARLGETGTMADVAALLQALRGTDDDARREAERAIWRIWSRSGDAKVDAVYQAGIEQMENGELRQAIATFTRVIEMKPEFAEGWNKRATLYFLVGEYRKSLADCDEVIKRNPDHFGALAGYAQIYARLEAYDRALDYARRALAINPNLLGVRQYIDLLEKLIRERRQQTV